MAEKILEVLVKRRFKNRIFTHAGVKQLFTGGILELKKNICEQPVEIGECSGVFPRFAFDVSTNECRRFTYGGCGGNGNNFATVEECAAVCVKGVFMKCQIVKEF